MRSKCKLNVGRFTVLASFVALAVVASGCKSFKWNPVKLQKQPPLMDSRGMVPPAYSEPGDKGPVSLPYEPEVGTGGSTDVLIPEEPLGTVEIVPPPNTTVELPPVLESETLTYEVKKGDSLWKIARSYGISHQELASYNKMKQDDMLVVGRILVIPPGGTFVPPAERSDVSPPPSSSNGSNGTAHSGGASAASGKRKLNDDGSYTVRSGDSLWLLARDFNTKVKDILAANNLTSDVLHIGQVLVIPTASGTSTGSIPVVNPSPEPNPVVPDNDDESAVTGTGTTTVDPVAPPTAALPNMLDYTVTEGDSLQNIADMFSIDVQSIKRANPDVKADADLRPNMNLRIPLN